MQFIIGYDYLLLHNEYHSWREVQKEFNISDEDDCVKMATNRDPDVLIKKGLCGFALYFFLLSISEDDNSFYINNFI